MTKIVLEIDTPAEEVEDLNLVFQRVLKAIADGYPALQHAGDPAYGYTLKTIMTKEGL